ncbi:MAG: hypothetical protein EXS13_12445 [Planctomycetes bacterium]|nr:hypothetical protein [Planctomycetota bacterium]
MARRFRLAVAVPLAAFALVRCDDGAHLATNAGNSATQVSTPLSTSAIDALPFGLSLFGSDLLTALPGDRPDARVRATLQLRFAEELPVGGSLVIDQACFDGERVFRGPELRYAIPELDPSAVIAIGELRADGGRPPPSPGGTVATARPLPRALGWFALDFVRAWPANRPLAIWLDVTSNPLPVEVELTASLDLEGEPPHPIAGRIPVRIVDPHVDWLRVLVPAQARPDEAVRASVVFMSGLSGPIASSLDSLVPTGTLELRGPFEDLDLVLPGEPDRRLPHAFSFELPPLPTGTQRIRARWREGGAVGLSPPIRVGSDVAPAWFGSLHSHTTVGGHATGVPSNALRYARDLARLDFVTLSEHRESAMWDGEWLRQLAESFTVPARFVVLNGYEWTNPDWGHRHIVFREPTAPGPAPNGLAALAESLGRDSDALLVAHHSIWNGQNAQRRFVWGDPGDLPRQRLAEVFSWHGSSLEHDSSFPMHANHEQELPREWQTDVLSALRAGHRLFLVADSDSHLGKPGNLVGIEWPKGRRYAFQGLTAITTPTLDRESIFRALDRGDCWGTTGARIVVEASREGLTARLRIAATAPLARVAIRTLDTGHGAIVAERRFAAPPPTAESQGARLFADPTVGTFDLDATFELQAGTAEQPWIIEIAQHDHHAAWRLLAPPAWSH